MFKVRFERFLGDDDIWGWLPIGASRGTGMIGASSPLTMVHDMLEHTHVSKIGTYSDELRALGAIMYVRVDSGYFSGMGQDGIDIVRSLLVDICQDFARYRAASPYTYTFPNTRDKHELEDTIQEMVIDYIHEDIHRACFDDFDEYKPCTYDEFIANLQPMLDQTKRLMLAGYDWASKRYARIWKDGAAHLFATLMDKLEAHPYIFTDEEYCEVEYVDVSYSLTHAGECTIKCHEHSLEY